MIVNNLAAGAAPHRRQEILEILKHAPVRSQEELQQRLRSRGIRVAQPTLSRDIRDLALVKTPAGYTLPEAAAEPAEDRLLEKLERALREFVVSVDTAATLVVLKTPPAAAHPVARALDEAGLPDVVGTIAGDDTIFLAMRSAARARKLAARLLSPIHPSRPRRQPRPFRSRAS